MVSNMTTDLPPNWTNEPVGFLVIPKTVEHFLGAFDTVMRVTPVYVNPDGVLSIRPWRETADQTPERVRANARRSMPGDPESAPGETNRALSGPVSAARCDFQCVCLSCSGHPVYPRTP